MTVLDLAPAIAAAGVVAGLLALASLLYTALNIVLLLRMPARTRDARPAAPVSVLVPLCGAEAGLYDRLARLCRQHYAGPFEIVCAAARGDDPALAVARRVAEDFPQRPLILVVDERLHGLNRKISNLANALAQARHDVLVFLDSDIVVDPDHLSRIVASLERPGVGAVTSLYHGVAGGGVWARLSALDIDLHFLPNVISGLRTGCAHPCFGATIAITRPVLSRIGGLAAFCDRLQDDYAIGAAVRDAGWEVQVSLTPVGHVCLERSARELIEGQLRRDRTIRMIDPVGYAGSVITHPVALACLAALLGGADGLALLATALVVRLAQCLAIEKAFGLAPHPYWAAPARDILSFLVYLDALLGGQVVWRGERYRVTGKGEMLPARPLGDHQAQPS